ncbi:universal stress protein [Nonomuraea soli]|uniref:Nucleotide-binding universal stress UspA family protein n=1 Tax=Nonomuraea soli TaxID=1032476 RepID=A0A7W0CF54_9ACTN|nr:universal stress protein [Nonomuraea soli]MBA2890031.1 nucleotide-binding universal stress UspA family protein [Nonomuraea soli]
MTPAVIVGVDGSASSMRATAWAAYEAALRDAPLRIVHATLRWNERLPLVRQPHRWDAERAVSTGMMLDRAVQRARECAPGVDMSAELTDGGAEDALTAISDEAALIVVGSRGRGGFAGMLLGSVGRHLTARAACPVAIVRGQRPRHGGEVAVGVTGLPGQEAVLEFAFREAELRGAGLRAVHAWSHPATRTPGDMQPLVYDTEEVGQEEGRLLAESLAGWRDKHPDVPVREDVRHTSAGAALVRVSADVGLVVVGARGGLLSPGPTAHALTHHARCPIVVVRH